MSQIVTTQIQPYPVSQKQVSSQQQENSASSTKTQFLNLNDMTCLNRIFSHLDCKERASLGSACKVLNNIHKSSYEGWARTMYDTNKKTDLLGRVGIQVPSSSVDAIEHSEVFFKNVKNRLEEINKTLPPGIKHKGFIKNLLLSEDLTIHFLETLYQYSLVQTFGEKVRFADAPPLKQKAELVLTWLRA